MLPRQAWKLKKWSKSGKRVSEDYRPFDVNITTSRAVYEAAAAKSRLIAVFSPTDAWFNDEQPDYAKVGGIATLNAFGTEFESMCWIFTNKVAGASNRAVTCSHELGHAFGLSHDGISTAEYYSGHGEGSTSWGPIMGRASGRSVVQWSSGEYPGYVGQTEDDVSIIGERLGLLVDEDQDRRNAARDLHALGGGDDIRHLLVGDGIITDRFDVDYLSYEAQVPGLLLLNARPYASTDGDRGANLDIRLQLLDASGAVLETANAVESLAATIIHRVESPGKYFLQIDGVGKDTADGYSDYASIGCYLIDGSFTFNSVLNIVGQPDELRVTEGQSVTSKVVASGSDLRFQWQRQVGDDWADVGLASTSPELSILGAQPADAGEYRVVVTDAVDSIISESVTLVVDSLATTSTVYQWTNFVGMPGGAGSEDGVGADGHFDSPAGLATDDAGNLYVADEFNHTIRRVTPAGVVSTLAGKPGQEGSSDGVGRDARFDSPKGVAVDATGNVLCCRLL